MLPVAGWPVAVARRTDERRAHAPPTRRRHADGHLLPAESGRGAGMGRMHELVLDVWAPMHARALDTWMHGGIAVIRGESQHRRTLLQGAGAAEARHDTKPLAPKSRGHNQGHTNTQSPSRAAGAFQRTAAVFESPALVCCCDPPVQRRHGSQRRGTQQVVAPNNDSAVMAPHREEAAAACAHCALHSGSHVCSRRTQTKHTRMAAPQNLYRSSTPAAMAGSYGLAHAAPRRIAKGTFQEAIDRESPHTQWLVCSRASARGCTLPSTNSQKPVTSTRTGGARPIARRPTALAVGLAPRAKAIGPPHQTHQFSRECITPLTEPLSVCGLAGVIIACYSIRPLAA